MQRDGTFLPPAEAACSQHHALGGGSLFCRIFRRHKFSVMIFSRHINLTKLV
jgi:hypothetical protein